jgi:hypothetical protein
MPGTWEGLCVDLDKLGAMVFAVRLQLIDGEKGSITIGFWTGAPTPVLQDTLEIERLVVKKGRVSLAARDGRRHVWSALLLEGSGLGFKDRSWGWIRAKVRLPGTAYRCEATLIKQPSDRPGPQAGWTFFSQFGELSKRLDPVEPSPRGDGSQGR